MSTEYPKIPALWKRASEWPRDILPGEFRSGAFEYLMDCPWIWTEKLDGTNVRIHWDGYGITFAGRTDRAQLNTMAGGALFEFLAEQYGTPEFEAKLEELFSSQTVVLYGEGIGPKIQKGGGDYGEINFVLFDIRVEGQWLEFGKVETLGKQLGIPVVPRYSNHRTLREMVALLKAAGTVTSKLKDTPAEGLVGQPLYPLRKPGGDRIMVKLKVEELA